MGRRRKDNRSLCARVSVAMAPPSRASALGGAAWSSPQKGRGAGRGGQGPNDGIEMDHMTRGMGLEDAEEETTALLAKSQQPTGGDEFDDGQALLDFADGRKRKNVHLEKCKAELEQRERARKEKAKYVTQPEFDSAFMAEVRTKVLEAELAAAR